MNLLEKAAYVSQLIPGYQYLYSEKADSSLIPHLLMNKYGCNATDTVKAEAACSSVISPDDTYVTQHHKSPELLEMCIGTCKVVAGDLEEMELIDEIAAKHLAPSHLELIGIHVIPEAYDDGSQFGFKASELAKLAASFRKLKHISVRGCFIEGNIASLQGPPLQRHFRLCYETAKHVTTALPCGMSYICFGACTDALYKSSAEENGSLQDICRAAQIVRHQNDTAFYAKLLIL